MIVNLVYFKTSGSLSKLTAFEGLQRKTFFVKSYTDETENFLSPGYVLGFIPACVCLH